MDSQVSSLNITTSAERPAQRVPTFADQGTAPSMAPDSFSLSSVAHTIENDLKAVKDYAVDHAEAWMAPILKLEGLVKSITAYFMHADAAAMAYQTSTPEESAASAEQKAQSEKVRVRKLRERKVQIQTSEAQAVEVKVQEHVQAKQIEVAKS